jgi:signal transduction histidine kinase
MMVHHMLDVARAVPTSSREAELGSCVREVFPVLARLAPKHNVVLQVEDGPVVAKVDPEAMERILMELVRNAAVNTPPGSRIAIFVEYVVRVVPAGLGHTSATMGSGRYACVSIEDQGKGIPRKYLPSDGELGATTDSNEVLHLGLPTYRTLARSMGGDLTIERSGSAGSVLRLWLRAA